MPRNSVTVLVVLLLSAGAVTSQEPPLATGFVWPLLSDYTVDPVKNTLDTRGVYPSCTAGHWYVNLNDFGNRTCPTSIGCSGANCYHPGEDWNRCPGNVNEFGESVYAVANGEVVNTGLVHQDGSTGSFVVIKHLLPADEELGSYVYPGTNASGTFSVVNSSYLHVANVLVGEGDIVRKGEKIAEIFDMSPYTHLHFEMQINGSRIDYCGGCGYCGSLQHLSNSGYIDPTRFISVHLDDIAARPIDSSFGVVELAGGPGAFGLEQGSVQAVACVLSERTCFSVNPSVTSWSEDLIILGLYGNGFSRELFDLPVVITVERGDGRALDSVVYPFRDMEVDAWYSPHAVDLWKRLVVSGRGTAGFLWPESQVTRAEFVKMLIAASGENCDSVSCTQTPAYQDISSGAWYYESVVVAYNLGWIAPAPFFRPAERIIRAEAAKLLQQALELVYVQTPADPYIDVDDVGLWYYNPVYAMQRESLMTGYSEGVLCEPGVPMSGRFFCPNRSLIRAEAFKILAAAFRGSGNSY